MSRTPRTLWAQMARWNHPIVRPTPLDEQNARPDATLHRRMGKLQARRARHQDVSSAPDLVVVPQEMPIADVDSREPRR